MTATIPMFRGAGPLAAALKNCLHEYQQDPRRRDAPIAYRRKVAIVLVWLCGSYVMAVFVAASRWQVICALVSLVLAAATVSFTVMHDAAHGAVSSSRSLNRALAMSLDLLGGSSYVWHWKHNVLHHSFPNIAEADSDIHLWPFARTSAGQPRLSIHRYQHLYMWVLYGFLPLRWYVGDIRFLLTGTILTRRFPRPRGRQLAALVAWKTAYVGWAIAIPMLNYPPRDVILVWLACLYCLGLILSTIFQLSHCVEGTHFPPPRSFSERLPLDTDWAVHQIRSTANFAHGNRLLTWFVGGLNYQIEHHLFPSLCHMHYPRLAPKVQQVCAEFGVPYHTHRTLGDALIAHYRWLRCHGNSAPTPSS